MNALNSHLRADNDDSGKHSCLRHVVHIQLDKIVVFLWLLDDAFVC